MRPAVPALLSAALGLAGPAGAATFTVTSTHDAVDIARGDGVCAAADGSCTLPAAVMEATSFPGPDTIILPAGRYTLTLPKTELGADADGDLLVMDDLTIVGAGPAESIIDGGGIDRVFPNLRSLRFTSLTVEGGRIVIPDFAAGGAGGLMNEDVLYLTRVVVRGNSAPL